ncbi:UDP-2,3-diacylglucosamine pyrophosphatase LpxG [Rubritalea halochordaticola]|uniref:UDP-2,3-diacylglucosamine pyrophosphatase LpxG n=1 Tax=Rubritalea halochordaticola TaxID=714537 RepID=A0ABP9V4N7_9BACT
MKLPPISRRKAIFLLGAGAIGSSLDAFFIEPNYLSITEKELKLPLLPSSLDGLRVAHLTDFHYDPDSDYELQEEVIKATNAQKPDIIALTGDFIDSKTKNIAPLLEHLSKLEAKHGVFAIMGNHDGWTTSGNHMKQLFEQAGITFLINENTVLNIGGDLLAIAGSDHIWHGHPDLTRTMKGLTSKIPTLALVHEPDFFDNVVAKREVMLQLSGHTHGGQCRVPLIGYAPKTVSFGRKYVYDTFKHGQSRLFVSRGVGTTGVRVRFACPPELAMLTLKSV